MESIKNVKIISTESIKISYTILHGFSLDHMLKNIIDSDWIQTRLLKVSLTYIGSFWIRYQDTRANNTIHVEMRYRKNEQELLMRQ